MNLESKIRDVINKVAINGTKGTSDNINQRVVIQATTAIIKLFKESFPEKKEKKVDEITGTTLIDFGEIEGHNRCLEEILNKLGIR